MRNLLVYVTSALLKNQSFLLFIAASLGG